MKYCEDNAKNNERWDAIAYRQYGDPFQITPLIEANSALPILPTLPEGAEIKVPILDQQTIDKESLPPWKQ